MRPAIINNPAAILKGKVFLPGDKSISHRASIIASLADGKAIINNFLFSRDTSATVSILRKLGVRIIADKNAKQLMVYGKGVSGLKAPQFPLYAGESGTTMRLLAGVLAGQNFFSELCAAKSLSRRPMRRICQPLRLMGADIKAKGKRAAIAGTPKAKLEEYPPLKIRGGNLKPITYKMPVASAQVKSAILFAGLFARGETRLIEPVKTRDHTERMLKLFGANIRANGLTIRIKKSRLVSPGEIYIPADISSAAFFIVLATLFPRSNLLLKSAGANPARCGIINKLKLMGADIKLKRLAKKNAEPMADIRVKYSSLRGIRIKAQDIPSMIDELPVFMVAASLAKGRTVIEGPQELRVKEADRINSMVSNLAAMGANISLKRKKDGSEYIEIIGVEALRGARVKSFGDHRTAMSMVVAGLIARGKTFLDDISCINKSFPEFVSLLRRFAGEKCIAA